MTAPTRNIYPIAPRWAVATLLLAAAVLALHPSVAQSQCTDVAGAGDEYCETLPGPDGDRNADGGRGSGNPGTAKLPPQIARELERAGAGAVATARSPRSTRRPTQAGLAPTKAAESSDGGTTLPYILAALAVAMGLAALARHLRGLGGIGTPPR